MVEKSSVSYVKLLLKQGVSKGSSMGWEAEICSGPEDSEEVLEKLIDKVVRLTEKLIKKPLIQPEEPKGLNGSM